MKVDKGSDKVKKMLFVAIGLVAALALSGMLGCTSSVAGEVTEVAVGDSFSFSLDSNPTTGYMWSAHFNPEFLELVDTEYEPSSDLIGAGGIESFEFRALNVGDTEITMVYERSWEEGYIEKAIYNVHITKAES